MTMMGAGSDIYQLETVSLNDDDQNGTHHPASPVLIDNLEAQLPVYSSNGGGSYVKSAKDACVPNPIVESDEDEDEHDFDDDDDIVVVVDSKDKPRSVPPSLPPLRVLDMSKLRKIDIGKVYGGMDDSDDGDYVDPTLFSPEVSRHAMDQAHRRARSLESELKELAALEPVTSATSPIKITPLEAVTIITGAFVSSVTKVKALVAGDTEYDLLGGSSPQTKMDDLDTDGDGLQLSPDASRGDGKHFQAPKLKPALKAISAYSAIEKTSVKASQKNKPPRRLKWDEEVLDQDEEFVDDGEDDLLDDSESESLMVNGTSSSAIANRQATPRSKKKRKKIVRSMMRRLTPREKEELYRLRPDLMIVPNWAQKYREEMTEADSTRWSFWLISIIGTLLILLVILIMLIAREKATVAPSK